jgi:hypothetical protein
VSLKRNLLVVFLPGQLNTIKLVRWVVSSLWVALGCEHRVVSSLWVALGFIFTFLSGFYLLDKEFILAFSLHLGFGLHCEL